MKFSLSHWYLGSGVVVIVSIPDLCPPSYFYNLRYWSETAVFTTICKCYNVLFRKISIYFGPVHEITAIFVFGTSGLVPRVQFMNYRSLITGNSSNDVGLCCLSV